MTPFRASGSDKKPESFRTNWTWRSVPFRIDSSYWFERRIKGAVGLAEMQILFSLTLWVSRNEPSDPQNASSAGLFLSVKTATLPIAGKQAASLVNIRPQVITSLLFQQHEKTSCSRFG